MIHVYHTTDTCSPDQQNIECVERKGIGHPDTIADLCAEAISIRYSRYCLEHYGVILHHNIDKFAVGGGLSEVQFGHGRIVKPITVTLNGRMSRSFAGRPVPYREIQQQAVSDVLAIAAPPLDVTNEVIFRHDTTDHSATPTWFNPRTLLDVPAATNPFASDTAVCVASWPRTPLEIMVLGIEAALYSPLWTRKFNDLGTDIKIMACRCGRKVQFVICVPLIADFTASLEAYYARCREVHAFLAHTAEKLNDCGYDIDCRLNTQDNCPSRRPYLTAVGTCLEFGEEGVVGRGNAASGVIAMNRPHSIEAPYGKNPLYHTGKVLSHRAQVVAKAIADHFQVSCTAMALARNGDPLEDCQALLLNTPPGCNPKKVKEIATAAWMNCDHVRAFLFEAPLIPLPFLGPPR